MTNVTSIGTYRQAGQTPAPERVLPVSIEAEQALLGAIISNGEAFHIATGIVRTEHFSEELHRRIFDVISGLVREGRPVTPPGLIAHLGNQELAEGLTIGKYIARLAAEAVTILNTPEYARTVRDMATRRDLITALAKFTDAAYGAKVGEAPEDLAAEALGRVREIVETAPRKRSHFHLGDGLAETIERIERVRRGEEKPRVIPTGFPDLDRALSGGLQPATIVIAAGRVGMGKTVLMTNLGFNVAMSGVGVLEFSLEIPDEEVKARHVAQVVFDWRRPLSFAAIWKAVDLTDDEVERIVIAQREIMSMPIVVECPPSVTVHEIVARIHVEKKRMAKQGVTLGVVLIDYLDKITASDRYAGQRTYEVQEIVTALKSAARAEEVCIVLLAQLNRATESREDKRPSLADLKSSGSLEQEAHAVIFIYREAYYLQKSAEYRDNNPEARARFEDVKHDVELILGKNRGGPETTVRLWGDVACSVLASSERRGR